MFRVLDIDAEGRATVREDNLDDFVRPPAGGQTRFVDCLTSTPEERALLQERFAFHPGLLRPELRNTALPLADAVLHGAGADRADPDGDAAVVPPPWLVVTDQYQ
jgi:hypothetical protein